jgi:N-acetylmuramic acid 6-phosphate etherase
MVDMPATNDKLRSRAVRMVELAAGVTRPMAVQALRDANDEVRVAIIMAKQRVSADDARKQLAGKSLRDCL